MRRTITCIILNVITYSFCVAQDAIPNVSQRKEIEGLINQYSVARESKDTALLRRILMPDIDQLVSTGEWRKGIGSAITGMLNSSATAPGTRTLVVDKIRMFHSTSAIVDCRYDIQSPDGTARRMWSTFVVVIHDKMWKITAIRNMLPAAGV